MGQEPEFDRFSKRYAAMSDGELERVVEESAELTEAARQALRAEIEKRELDISVDAPEPPAAIEPELQDWMTVRRFRDLHEAMLAKGSLESAGIDCRLTDDNMVRLDWFISNLLGGVKLVVKPEDVKAAEQILNQPIPEGFDYGDGASFQQPQCPKCGSLDISFESLNKPVAYGSAWLGVPIPLKAEKWICGNCGVRWVEEEDGDEQLESSY